MISSRLPAKNGLAVRANVKLLRLLNSYELIY